MDELSKKPGGRPKKNSLREQRVYVYFTKTEYATVQARISKAHSELSSYMREMALNGKINARLSEEERHLFRELINMSNDLHQLVEMARKDGMLKVMLHFEQYRNKIDELLNTSKHAQ